MKTDVGCFFCRSYEFNKSTLLCKTQCFYIVCSDMWLNNTHSKALLPLYCNSGYPKAQQCYVTIAFLNFFIVLSSLQRPNSPLYQQFAPII